MAFDFKTATPDTTFPANGFLFGADSQSAADPSIYSHTAYLNYILSLANTWQATQTIALGTITSDAQNLSATATWNNAGVTFTALKLNVTDTASNAASLLQDWQVGGTSVAQIRKNGLISGGVINSSTSPSFSAVGMLSGTGITFPDIARIGWSVTGSGCGAFTASGIQIVNGLSYSWASTATATPDLYLYRDAANTLAQRNGTSAQAFHLYDTYTDSSNYGRVKLSYDSGSFCYLLLTQAAGTGAPRSLNLGCGNISASGQWQINQAAGHFLALSDNTYDIGASGANRPRRLYLGGGSLTGSAADSSLEISPTWNTTGTPTAIKLNVTDTASNALSLFIDLQIAGSSKFKVIKDGRAQFEGFQSNNGSWYSAFQRLSLAANVPLTWTNTDDNASTTRDLYLYRDAANTLAQRNSTNAQAFRIYNTYTDASNYERGFVQWSSNVFQIGAQSAGTGTARTLELVVNGSARLAIATDGGVTVAGYIQTPIVADNSNNTWRIDSSGFALGDDNTLRWSSITSPNGTADSLLNRSAAGVIGVRGANTTSGGALEFVEQTAPSAGATNSVRIYAQDNGAGKTQLMALFATGAAQQIAIEP